MRVLTFLHSFETGGVERTALRLVRHWQAAGLDAPLWIGRVDGPMRAQFAQGPAYDTPRRLAVPIGWMETLWMIFHLPAVIRKVSPDVLFCAGNSYTVVAVALKILLGRNCPPVVVKISNDLVRPDMPALVRAFYRYWVRLQGRRIDHFVAMSDPLAEQIAQTANVGFERITVIANPSLEALHERCEGEPASRDAVAGRSFCVVGRLSAQKNLAFLTRAFAKGRREGDHLTFYGDGPELARLSKLVRKLGMEDAVTFAGFVPCPPDEMTRHHVLLLSSRYEGLPSVVVEALEAGLHIIATDCCCSMDWLLGHGALGTLVPVGDEDAMVRAIAGAPKGQGLPEQALAKAGLHRIHHVAPRYVQLFDEVSRPVRTAHSCQPSHPHKMEFAR